VRGATTIHDFNSVSDFYQRQQNAQRQMLMKVPITLRKVCSCAEGCDRIPL
jgi:hypothetical protein